MANYIPNELKDIKDMKQRVMHNVIKEIENNAQKPKYRFGIVMLTAVFTVSAILFLFNYLFVVDQQSTTAPALDFTKPLFEDKQGIFYLNGLTLGDSKSKVVELLGEQYLTEIQEDGSDADLILVYKEDVKFYFYQENLSFILLLHTNEDLFEKLYNEYNGMKFTSDGHRYIHSSETSHIIKAEFTPDEDLNLSLAYADPDQLLENEGFLKIKESSE